MKSTVKLVATPRTVITSRAAKDNLFSARSLMDETYSGIVQQRNRLNVMASQKKQADTEIQKNQQDFQQKRTLQQEKVNAVNSLM